jgi:hypothetical protein
LTQLVACLLCSIILLVIIPLLIVRVILCYRDDLDEKEIRDRFGTIYMGMRTDIAAGVFSWAAFLSIRLAFVIVTFSLKE